MHTSSCMVFGMTVQTVQMLFWFCSTDCKQITLLKKVSVYNKVQSLTQCVFIFKVIVSASYTTFIFVIIFQNFKHIVSKQTAIYELL